MLRSLAMSITEVRCLQTSTHLLGTVLHLDDVIGTFAGRHVAAISDSLAITLLSVAARVAVTAGLIFVEFGILSMYSPLLTGALIIGMYFYPVPEQTIAPIRPPLPPVGAEPAPLISGTLPEIIYPPQTPASPVRVTAPTTPTTAIVSPYRPLSSSVTRPLRPESLARRSLLFTDAPTTPLSTSTINQQSTRATDLDPIFRSEIVTSSTSEAMMHRRTTSTGSQLTVQNEFDVHHHDDENLSSSDSYTPSSPPPTPQVEVLAPAVSSTTTSTLIHRHVAPPTFSPGSVVDHSIQSYQGTGAKDFLIVLFQQALGDDLGPFFVNTMLPPNIDSAEYNPATKNFTFTLIANKETTIRQVGPHAIEGVQGCSLKIRNVVRGTLNNDLQGISFRGESMQMGGTRLMVPYTVTLTGLRRNFNQTITLAGEAWFGNGNVTGTLDQFRDTFSFINWNAQ